MKTSEKSDERQIRNIKFLIKLIENSPKYKKLSDIAKSNESDIEINSSEQSVNFKNIVFRHLQARPEEFYGQSIVYVSVKKKAKSIAQTVTISNWINFIFTLPILCYAFSGSGIYLSSIASLLSGLGILSFTNAVTEVAAKRSQDNKTLPTIASIGMLLINGTLTVSSIAGAELFINQYELSNNFAKIKVDKYLNDLDSNNVIDKSPYYSRYLNSLNNCKLNEEELDILPTNTYQRNQLFIKTYGTYETYIQWRDGKVNIAEIPLEKAVTMPVCQQKDIYLNKINTDLEKSKLHHQKLITQRGNFGSDIEFLKKDVENIYSQYFNKNGNFKSGGIAIEAALNSFIQKIADGRISQLGFSLFLGLVSVITSLISCLLVISFSMSEETRKSYSTSAALAKDQWLDKTILLLQESHQNEKDDLDKN